MVDAARVVVDGSAVDTAERPDVSDLETALVAVRTSGARSARPASSGARPAGPAKRPGRDWSANYRRALVAFDFVGAATAAASAFVLRMSTGQSGGDIADYYIPAAVVLPVLWVVTLALCEGYDKRVLGLGPEEYQRVGRAFVMMLAAIGFGSYALNAQVARSFVVLAVPLTLAFSLIGRFALRKRLHGLRGRGVVRTNAVAVGDAESVADLARRIHAEKYIGMHVVGACVPAHEITDPGARALLAAANVMVLGDLDSVLTAVNRSQADTVAVASSSAMTREALRSLSWQLERTSADLIVAPGLIEVAGPRLHIRPLTGLPLLHVEKPEFAGGRRVLKSVFDRSAALLGMLVISPLLIGLWLAVRLTSAGPAFFTQTRVGRDGQEFRIWKFRSMFVDAEERRAALAEHNENADGLLFKMHDDPRVTRVGRFIRRYSLDELPQLFNVVNGTMSLVGPRPPLPSEVARYGFDVRRRLLVRPGLTGLWQVSGRSDLSWEESVRLDLRYVENWSFGQDALILWKTVSAVARGAGAY